VAGKYLLGLLNDARLQAYPFLPGLLVAFRCD
jgi:hypothetical protein